MQKRGKPSQPYPFSLQKFSAVKQIWYPGTVISTNAKHTEPIVVGWEQALSNDSYRSVQIPTFKANTSAELLITEWMNKFLLRSWQQETLTRLRNDWADQRVPIRTGSRDRWTSFNQEDEWTVSTPAMLIGRRHDRVIHQDFYSSLCLFGCFFLMYSVPTSHASFLWLVVRLSNGSVPLLGICNASIFPFDEYHLFLSGPWFDVVVWCLGSFLVPPVCHLLCYFLCVLHSVLLPWSHLPWSLSPMSCQPVCIYGLVFPCLLAGPSCLFPMLVPCLSSVCWWLSSVKFIALLEAIRDFCGYSCLPLSYIWVQALDSWQYNTDTFCPWKVNGSQKSLRFMGRTGLIELLCLSSKWKSGGHGFIQDLHSSVSYLGWFNKIHSVFNDFITH